MANQGNLTIRVHVVDADKASKKLDILTAKIEKAIKKYEKLLKLADSNNIPILKSVNQDIRAGGKLRHIIKNSV